VFNEPALAAMIATWPEDQFRLFDCEPPEPIAAKGIMSGMSTAIVHAGPRRPFEDA